MKKFTFHFLLTAMVVSTLSGCFFKKKKKYDSYTSSYDYSDSYDWDDGTTTTEEKPKSKKVDITKLEYQYDEVSRECKNKAGKVGYNYGITHCGKASFINDKYGNYSALDLRGLYVDNSWLSGANFDFANLENATFKVTDLSWATFKNANLKGIEISVADANAPSYEPYFKGAKFNRNSSIYFSYNRSSVVKLVQTYIGEYEGLPEVELLKEVNDRNLIFSNDISSIQKRMILEDLAALNKINIQADVGGLYDSYFSGNTGSVVAKYVADRVNFISSPGSVDKATIAAANGSHSAFSDKLLKNLYGRMDFGVKSLHSLSKIESDYPGNIPEPSPDEIDEFVTINGQKYPINSCMVGKTYIGGGYFSSTPAAIGTWIHEATHSNCFVANRIDFLNTYKALKQDIQLLVSEIMAFHAPLKYKMWKDMNNTEQKNFNSQYGVLADKSNEMSDKIKVFLEQTKQTYWGHDHVNCPYSHKDPLVRGMKKACDAHAFGAYAAEGIFASVASKKCLNCTERVKQTYKMESTNAFARVLVLDDMLNGTAKPRRGELRDEDWVE